MSADSAMQNQRSPLEIYRSKMSGIEFMDKYLEDPAIFNPDSPKFKNFLIDSFSYLYPYFHYLSFLTKEDVDLEIIKAAHILQILPRSTKKMSKLFENMSKSDIHKFWLRFFTLFNKGKDFSTDSSVSVTCENKTSFFKDITSTLNYLNYQFPVVNMNKINCVNIDEEIGNWTKGSINVDHQLMLTTSGESESSNKRKEAHQKHNKHNIDINKLIVDLKQVSSMFSSDCVEQQDSVKQKDCVEQQDSIKQQDCVEKQEEPEYEEFFRDFISLTENILQYMKNLSVIESTSLDEIKSNISSNDKNLPETLNFLKRCNNSIKSIKNMKHPKQGECLNKFKN